MKTFLYKIYTHCLFFLFFLFSSLFSPIKLWATHIAGSDICVQYISSQNGINRYSVIFKITRDNHGVQMGKNLNLKVEYPNGGYKSVSVKREKDVYFFSDCDERFEIHEFEGYIDVPEYYYSFKIVPEATTLCCRNNSPFYDLNGGGNYYTYVTVDNNVSGGNSTPCFQLDNNVACVGKPFSINLNTMIDNDGDNLDISIVNPMVNENTLLVYKPGYDYLHPCQTLNNEGVTIQNGVLSFTPVGVTGNTVIAIKVREIRNGVVVGETIKEFTIVVKNCAQTAPYSLGIEDFNGAVKSKVSNFELNTCVNESVCITIKSYDFEKSKTKITITNDLPGSYTYVQPFSGTKNDYIYLCWTPSYQDFGLNKLSYCVTDEAPCGLDSSLRQCYDVYINVDGCKEEDWCYHPCAPNLGKLDIMFQNTTDRGIVLSSNSHPMLINIMNATGYEMNIIGLWAGNYPIYTARDFNPNGLDWREYNPAHLYSNDWLIKWDGRLNDGGHINSSFWVFDVILTYWNCNEKKKIEFGVNHVNDVVYDPDLPVPVFFTSLNEIPKDACCKPNYTLTFPHIKTVENFNAVDYIISKDNAKVLNNNSVFYTAGNSITLLPNFIVEPGAFFSAKIEKCESLFNSNENSFRAKESLDSRFGFNNNINNFRKFQNGNNESVKYSLVDVSGRILQKNVIITSAENVSEISRFVHNSYNLSSGVYFLVPDNIYFETIKFLIH